jgi:antitoxin ParD1/3/4
MSTTGTMNIALPEAMRAYVAKRVGSRQFGNTSKYVRELIRRDQREPDIARLRAMVEEGLASGPAIGSPALGQTLGIEALRAWRPHGFPLTLWHFERAEHIEVVRLMGPRQDQGGVEV